MRWNWYHSTIKWSRRNAMKKNKEKWKKKKIRTRIRIAYVRSYCSLSDILARVLVIYFITDICMKRYCLYVDFLVPFFPFNKLFFLLFCISCSVLFDHFHSFAEHSPFHVQFRFFFPFQSLCHNFFLSFSQFRCISMNFVLGLTCTLMLWNHWCEWFKNRQKTNVY